MCRHACTTQYGFPVPCMFTSLLGEPSIATPRMCLQSLRLFGRLGVCSMPGHLESEDPCIQGVGDRAGLRSPSRSDMQLSREWRSTHPGLGSQVVSNVPRAPADVFFAVPYPGHLVGAFVLKFSCTFTLIDIVILRAKQKSCHT
jgi:hypothetical protein